MCSRHVLLFVFEQLLQAAVGEEIPVSVGLWSEPVCFVPRLINPLFPSSVSLAPDVADLSKTPDQFLDLYIYQGHLIPGFKGHIIKGSCLGCSKSLANLRCF